MTLQTAVLALALGVLPHASALSSRRTPVMGWYVTAPCWSCSWLAELPPPSTPCVFNFGRSSIGLKERALRCFLGRRSTWSVYGCDISEELIKEQAIAIDKLGLRAAGYTYIDIGRWPRHLRYKHCRVGTALTHVLSALSRISRAVLLALDLSVLPPRLPADDCWQAYNRSADGVQIANASLFPSGMKSLAGESIRP